MKKLVVLLLALMMVVGSVGCGTETKNKETTKKEVVQKADDKEKVANEEDDSTSTDEVIEGATVSQENRGDNSDSITNENDTTSNQNESTTNKTDSLSNKNNTGSSNNGSNNSNSGSSNNSGSNNSGNTGSTNTATTPSEPVHEHTWTEVTEDEIHYYDWRTICGKCGLDMTDMTDEELTVHTAAICHSRYSVKYIEVDYVTENVVKTPVLTGYKCECGATKK